MSALLPVVEGSFDCNPYVHGSPTRKELTLARAATTKMTPMFCPLPPYLKRSAHLPQEIKDIGWKAQTRLCKRYRALSRTGKPQPRVLGAIARELAGFIWDIARRTPLTA